MNQLAIALTGGDVQDDYQSLLNWLRREDDLPPAKVLRATSPGTMGPVTDAVVLIVGSGGVATLGRALIVWLRQRRTDITVTVKANGRAVQFEAKGITEERASEMIRQLLEESGGKAGE